MSGRKVMIWVPGLNTRDSDVDVFTRAVSAELGDGWELHAYPHGVRALSVRRLDDVAADLAAQIRVWCDDLNESADVDEVVLAGHSMGGLILRAAYLRDLGTIDDDPAIRGQRRRWTEKVTRIVLFASPNSGFRFSRMKLTWRIAWAFATPLRDFAIEQVESGAYWLSTLRLRWIDAMRRHPCDPPTIVQVLGTRDGLVGEQDMLDARYLGHTVRIDVPGADHDGLVRDLGAERMPLIMAALRGTAAERTEARYRPDSGPTYFLLHGIRASAYGDWVPKLRDAIGAVDPGAEVVSPDYGFFSASDFALPWIRNRKTHSFLRWYAEMYASRDPEQFRFAGHSNGTYLMANAMLRVPAMRFRRVYLAGSVLPREFAWRDLAERRQIGHYEGGGGETARRWVDGLVHNDRARVDVPVGFLCSWLRGLGMSDIGTGGLDGFVEAPGNLIREHAMVFRGGHGGAFVDQTPPSAERGATRAQRRDTREQGQLDRIAQIAGVLHDDTPDVPPGFAPSSGFRLLSRMVGNRVIAWAMLLALVALVVLVAVLIGAAAGPTWGVTAAAIIVLAVVVFLRTF